MLAPGATPRNPPAGLRSCWLGCAARIRSMVVAAAARQAGRVITLTGPESTPRGLPTAAPALGEAGTGTVAGSAPAPDGAPVPGVPVRGRGLPGEPRLALGWALLAAV